MPKMQRASGQYDYLARVPRTSPRQSRGRRSFAPRHWCRAAPRRSHGMGTTVRNPRIESAIGLELLEARLSADDSRTPASQLPSQIQSRGTEFLGAETGSQKIHPGDRYCRQRPGTLKIGGNIPAETASFLSTTVSAVREDWLVGATGIEPVTPSMSTRCSPAELRALKP